MTEGNKQFCTCDGAGRGPGRPCVVKAGCRLGEAWQCREAAEARKPIEDVERERTAREEQTCPPK